MNFLALSRQEVRLHHHSLRGIEKPIYYTIKNTECLFVRFIGRRSSDEAFGNEFILGLTGLV